MKAALMYGPNDIRIETIAKPQCPKGGLVLKVEAIGLCGSDIRNLTTDSTDGKYPHIFGHEHVGVISEIDPCINKYKLDDRVYIHPAPPCLKCDNCRSGHSENCTNKIQYIKNQGGFAEYMAFDSSYVEREGIFFIPENINFTHATLAEPMASVYACQENIDVKFGDIIVIIGAGPIGCFHAKLAKLRGARTVIMVEINDDRLTWAKKFGVDYTINSTRTDVIETIKSLTNGIGADKVISANPSITAQAQSIFLVRKGGIVVFFGGVPKNILATIDTNYVHYNNIWIYGHSSSNSMQCQKAFELVISRSFQAEDFITHVLPLDEINEGIYLAKSGTALKVVLIP